MPVCRLYKPQLTFKNSEISPDLHLIIIGVYFEIWTLKRLKNKQVKSKNLNIWNPAKLHQVHQMIEIDLYFCQVTDSRPCLDDKIGY